MCIKYSIYKKSKKTQGFSLVELMVVAAILGTIVLGLIQSLILSSALVDLSNRKTIATSEAQDKIEEIVNHTFNTVVVDYASGGTPGNVFNLSQVTGTGVVTAAVYTANVVQVDVVVSFQMSNGRVVGEDKDLDGVLDVGEDANSNGVLDSPVKLSTYIRQG